MQLRAFYRTLSYSTFP